MGAWIGQITEWLANDNRPIPTVVQMMVVVATFVVVMTMVGSICVGQEEPFLGVVSFGSADCHGCECVEQGNSNGSEQNDSS